ncbi:hypothetical protein Cni_G17063 [Canna indica]|uniref:DUF4283 domain-containing protein n=1 Tax=Canna indica TaxID=4628 RepID=A0AAQ3QHE5_9LILI|nr:hypothetical protein Cni_G17063 [Canna indica]
MAMKMCPVKTYSKAQDSKEIRSEDDWRYSTELSEKIRRIKENVKGMVKIIDEDLDAARESCNLVLYGRFFGRTPNLKMPLREIISTIPIWVQLPGLPYKFMNQNILPQIVAALGRPIKIDDYTISGERGKFARICILFDITYENVPNLCYTCGRICHKDVVCPVIKNYKEKGKELDSITKNDEKDVEERVFGP